jgi:predicted XRE-type DNA-binding protein
MTGKRYASVWDAIEDTPQEAENMKIRAALMEKLIDFIDDSGMPQGEIAERLGVTQPRISDLVRGKIDLFSIDALVNMLVAAGLKVDLLVVPSAPTPARSTRKTSAAASPPVRADGSRKSGAKAAAKVAAR